MNLESILNKFARLISTLFVPPVLMLGSFIFASIYLQIDKVETIFIIIVTAIFGFIIPIVYFIALLKKGKVVNEDAVIKEERTKPFVTGIFIVLFGLVFLTLFTSNSVIIAFWICYLMNAIIITIINKFWKISAHSMGASTPLALIVILIPQYVLFYGIVVLLIGWSRLQLKCHTIAQVIAGIAVGFASTYFHLKIILHFFNYGY